MKYLIESKNIYQLLIVLISIVVSSIQLFFIGRLNRIQAMSESSVITLFIICLLTLCLLSLINQYILKKLLILKTKSIGILILTLVIAMVSYSLVFSLRNYILIGDFLYTYGLNWYYMDYSGFVITFGSIFYCFIGFSILLYPTIKEKVKRKK